MEHTRITTLATGLDGAVRRISYTYDSLGRRDEVTQHDNASVGSGSIVDEVKHTYDDWGQLTNFEQDHDSAVGSGTADDYEAKYTYAKSAPAAGWQTLRLSSRELVHASTVKDTVNYDYLSTDGLVDDSISRVTRVKDGLAILASYDYLGRGMVIGVDVEPLDVMWHKYNETTTSTMDDLDRFNRVTTCKWTKDLTTDVDFYKCDINVGKVGQIFWITDEIYPDWDWHYVNDDRNRLTVADRGTLSGGVITNRVFRERWTLDELGNWTNYKLDLNGDGDELDTGELNDNRTYNDVNEMTSDSVGYDALGQMTDTGDVGGSGYDYVYDAFGRLVEIKNQEAQPATLALFKYNGLGHRIVAIYDSNGDGAVDPGPDEDDWLHYAYDAQWRIIGIFTNDSSTTTEAVIHHVGGAFGRDGIVSRLRDSVRHYPLQNTRGDVVVSFRSNDELQDHSRFTAYGTPYVVAQADYDNDGDIDSVDTDFYDDTRDNGPYDVRCDFNLDGSVNSGDDALHLQAVAIALFGRDELSNTKNYFGYAGYRHDETFYQMSHVRNRVLNADFGSWSRRDPIGYRDGMNLYGYVGSSPLMGVDPMGLAECPSGGVLTDELPGECEVEDPNNGEERFVSGGRGGSDDVLFCAIGKYGELICTATPSPPLSPGCDGICEQYSYRADCNDVTIVSYTVDDGCPNPPLIVLLAALLEITDENCELERALDYVSPDPCRRYGGWCACVGDWHPTPPPDAPPPMLPVPIDERCYTGTFPVSGSLIDNCTFRLTVCFRIEWFGKFGQCQ